LDFDHVPELAAAAAEDPHTFLWFPEAIDGEVGMHAWVARALLDHQAGRALPFAILAEPERRVVGSTRFTAIDLAHARAEIGYTWIAASVRRSLVNTECKRLLLAHGFETLGLNRIELKTDSLNQRSAAAILRLGAQPDGVFRNHMIVQGGRLRHTVWFSVIREDWPAVRERLDGYLAAAP
jgi:RimJ/RimL family protein N-acetyltransferase